MHAESTIVAYQWLRREAWEGLSAVVSGAPALPQDDAEETFITEHYWGYSQQADRSTVEYQVEHPRWRVWRANTASFECEVLSLYGSLEAVADPARALRREQATEVQAVSASSREAPDRLPHEPFG